jgi:WD40 repeat protein
MHRHADPSRILSHMAVCLCPVQGHSNSIACLAATEDRSIIITADVGNESLLVLWDSVSGNPVRSIPRPHAHGVLTMDMSPGGDWLATISAPNPTTSEQEVSSKGRHFPYMLGRAARSASSPGARMHY